MNKKSLKVFTNGVFTNNPVLVSMLGACPTLAVTTSLMNGIGMGLASTFVLICSNITISLLKNIIPSQVRLPCFIVTIASFVTLVERLVEAFIPPLYESLGLFLPLIAVNCIVLGRAEVFASKNKPLISAVDGLGSGLGFTLALALMGSIRELLGSGSLLSGTNLEIKLPFISENPVTLFILPAGGFFTYAIIIAVMNHFKKTPSREFGCENCPSRKTCIRSNDPSSEECSLSKGD